MQQGNDDAGEFLNANSPIKQPATADADKKKISKKKKSTKAPVAQGSKTEDTDKYKDHQLFNYTTWIDTKRLELPGPAHEPNKDTSLEGDVRHAKRGLIRLVDENKVQAVAKAFSDHNDVYDPNYPVSLLCVMWSN